VLGSTEDDEWKTVTAKDIATKRWYDLWVTTENNNTERKDCLNITKYPPFPKV
jgi:hypothetical protein